MSQHIRELLHDYLDDELNTEERDAIEKHLDLCSDCKEELSELTSIRQQIVNAYRNIEIPNSIEDTVLDRIEQESIKAYSGLLNRTAVIMLGVFGLIFLAGATPFLTVGIHIFTTLFSIGRGLIYAIPSILAAIPYVAEVLAIFILLITSLALLMLRYLVHTMRITVGAEDI